MGLRDYNVDWLEKRIFLATNTVLTPETVTTAVALQTWVSATSVMTQVASSKVSKLGMTAQNDGVSWLLPTPYDLDIKKQVRFRVHYTQTATSGTATFKVLYDQLVATAAGTAGATVIAAAATALDTAIPAASGTVVASDYRVTGFGVINRNTLLQTADAWIIALTVTDSSPNAGLGMLALEIRYTPRRTAGPRRNILGARRLATANPLGVQLHTTQEGL